MVKYVGMEDYLERREILDSTVLMINFFYNLLIIALVIILGVNWALYSKKSKNNDTEDVLTDEENTLFVVYNTTLVLAIVFILFMMFPSMFGGLTHYISVGVVLLITLGVSFILNFQKSKNTILWGAIVATIGIAYALLMKVLIMNINSISKKI